MPAPDQRTVFVVMPMLHGKTTIASAFPGPVVDADALYAPRPQRWRDMHSAAIMRRDWASVAYMENEVIEEAVTTFPHGRVVLLHNDSLRVQTRAPWVRGTDRWYAIEPLRLGDLLHRARLRCGVVETPEQAAAARGVTELAVANWRHHLDQLPRWTDEGVKMLSYNQIIRLAADRMPRTQHTSTGRSVT